MEHLTGYYPSSRTGSRTAAARNATNNLYPPKNSDQQNQARRKPSRTGEARSSQFKAQIIHNDLKLSDKDYFSATDFGRNVIKEHVLYFNGWEQVLNQESKPLTRIQVLADSIDAEVAYYSGKRGRPPAGIHQLRTILTAIEYATKAYPLYGGNCKPSHLLAVATVKAVVDGFGIGGSGRNTLPERAAVVQRIGDLVNTQMLDAVCLCFEPEAYARQEGRWNRKNQGVTNKHANISIAQSQMLGGKEFKKEISFDPKDRAEVGSKLLDLLQQDLDLIVKDSARRQGVKAGIPLIRPTKVLIDQYPAFIDQLAVGSLRGYPMIEEPLEWQHTEAPGHLNHTGGYHLTANRMDRGMVRTRFGDNNTILSPLAVQFLNDLGKVKYVPDVDLCKSFDFAVVGRNYDGSRLDVDGVHGLPKITTADLDKVGDANKASIEERGYIVVDGVPLFKGTDEHNAWRAERSKAYDDAIDAQQKFIRTRQALGFQVNPSSTSASSAGRGTIADGSIRSRRCCSHKAPASRRHY